MIDFHAPVNLIIFDSKIWILTLEMENAAFLEFKKDACPLEVPIKVPLEVLLNEESSLNLS